VPSRHRLISASGRGELERARTTSNPRPARLPRCQTTRHGAVVDSLYTFRVEPARPCMLAARTPLAHQGGMFRPGVSGFGDQEASIEVLHVFRACFQKPFDSFHCELLAGSSSRIPCACSRHAIFGCASTQPGWVCVGEARRFMEVLDLASLGIRVMMCAPYFPESSGVPVTSRRRALVKFRLLRSAVVSLAPDTPR
jgi:hypothetical protein